jgi:hypothetical protein
LITTLAKTFKTSPYQIVKGLIDITKSSKGSDVISSQTSLKFYESLFNKLSDPLQLLGPIIHTEREPLLTWIARDEVVKALITLYEESEETPKQLQSFLGYDDYFELVRRLAGLGHGEVARRMLHNVLNKAQKQHRIALPATVILIFVNTGMIVYEVIAYTRNPSEWNISVGAPIIFTLIGLLFAIVVLVESSKALKTADRALSRDRFSR